MGRPRGHSRSGTFVAARALTPLAVFDSSRILVFGTGALACALGGRLARGGAGVTLTGGWAEGREALSRRGIVVHEPEGPWSARVDVAPLGETTPPVDLALVLVKSPQTRAVAPFVARAVSPTGRVVTLQNGLGNREALEAALGAGRVAAGVALLGATLLGPGEVRVVPGRVVLGVEPEREETVGALSEALRAGGIEVELTSAVPRLVWRKLVANCAINPLTGLAGLPNGALLEDEVQRETLLAAAAEVGAVAAARGLDLGEDPATLAVEVVHATASNRSSMLQDLARGAETEIDALNGAVVAEGRRLGVPTPVNESLWRQVRAREGRPVRETSAAVARGRP
jgi:2-dehydropantoate 2-reductase